MKARTVWTKNKMRFTGECDGKSIELDAKPPFGDSQGLTPKELVAIAAAGCTGMDVVGLLKKYKQPLESFEVLVDAPPVEKIQPPIFKEIVLDFVLTGQLDEEKVLEAVRLSQTKYCAVSGMLAKTVPIRYRVVLNGKEIGIGEAHFE